MTFFSKSAILLTTFLLSAFPVHAAEWMDGASVDVPVSIVWNDQEDNSSARPSEITLMLLKNELNYQEITLSAAENWTATINGLPATTPETSDLTADSSDIAAKWSLESSNDNNGQWLQYTADSDWTTSKYSVAAVSTSQTELPFRVTNSSDTPYLVFYGDKVDTFLSDQNGSIVQLCPLGETDFVVPDNASNIYVSHLNNDKFFSVQALNPEKQSSVVYSVRPSETVPCYIPSAQGTTITYTAANISVPVSASWTELPQQDAELRISLNASGKSVASIILTASNNWQAKFNILRKSPFIHFSDVSSTTSSEKVVQNASSLSGHWFSILGDSFSEVSEEDYGDDPEGYGLDSKWWYRAASSLGMNLLSNQGIGGSGVNVSTSEDCQNTAFDRINLLKTDSRVPDDILILLGINDLISGQTKNEFISNYRKMLDKLQEAYPQTNLILFTYPQVHTYFSSTILQCNQLIRQIASEYGFVVIDLENWSVSEEKSTSYLRTNDTLHPNRKGQLLMGEMAAEQLKQISITDYNLSIQASKNYQTELSYKEGSFILEVSSDASQASGRRILLLIIGSLAVLLGAVILIILFLKRQQKYL